MSASLFRVGVARTELLAAPEALREGFARHRAMECPGMLAPDLLAMLMARLADARFEPEHVDKIGDRELEVPPTIGQALSLVLKRDTLFDWLDSVTGCGPLATVKGRMVQARAGQGHQLSWHDDGQDKRRRLGITINLSTNPYEGALFEIRRKDTHAPLFAHRHTDAGTALIFDVAADIQHRVLPVIAGGPRRVFTGWFFRPEDL